MVAVAAEHMVVSTDIAMVVIIFATAEHSSLTNYTAAVALDIAGVATGAATIASSITATFHIKTVVIFLTSTNRITVTIDYTTAIVVVATANSITFATTQVVLLASLWVQLLKVILLLLI